MQALEARYPGAQLYFVLFKHIKESIEVSELIPKENLFLIESGSLWSLLRDTIKFTWQADRGRLTQR